MGRWEPNTRERLFVAALELYAERGFDQTTVAEIARRAGLTERTFFRHFPDKREVLFMGSGLMADGLSEAVARAPESSLPMGAVAAALDAACSRMQERRASVLVRQAVVSSHAELRERELVKRARLVEELAGALRARGVAPLTAELAAEAGLGAFRVAFQLWVGPQGEARGLSELIAECFAQLRAVAAESTGERPDGAAGGLTGGTEEVPDRAAGDAPGVTAGEPGALAAK